MAYNITPENDGKYIIIKVTGTLLREDAMQMVTEAFERGAELGIKRYLMDLTEALHSWGTLADYVFVRDDLLKQSKFNRNARTAVLVAPEDTSHDFIITVL